ncbi:MAG: tRNA (adenosine(37)-N6)-threonylcarbamoyltransferase complex transferase subunit TsaD [Patescibacteria group bacterium]|nr:tRNA (adenosine(37)-N6)-threonylcarbamoyltransferase complex transferase subunit TsaD [Patescibacteria group bacterium]
MKILAIETSCDETAIAIVDVKKNGTKTNFKILGNDLASQVAIHTQYGGVFPMMAKREHSKNIIPIFVSALKKAKIYKKVNKIKYSIELNNKIIDTLVREQELIKKWHKTMPYIAKPKIDAIAVTVGPGLEPALWVGINFAQALSLLWDIPIIPVNHMEGHIFSIFPNKTKTFTVDMNKKMFPVISLLVSGGHTEIVVMKDFMKYKIIGSTRDDAVGEAFDKVARMLGLPYPGGPEISKLARIERENDLPSTITLPRPMLHSKDYDFSFSGLKTSVLYFIRDLPKGKFDDNMKQKIAREFEDAAVDVLTAKTLRAVKFYKAKNLIVGGGVSANTHLQKNLTKALQETDSKINFPTKDLCTDNALMIAIAGYFQSKSKKIKNMNSKIIANGNLAL